ncbi:hypothetical protein DLAC_03177 [Tieghemostelium lacteum]|uniref:RRM domain-containing protein n=1 Tax=Tieghemostelium lacteum TaxID=361077 RepID=A0A152A2E4_TIELA|nr:hypothetical protein DLAC_03177 [Tieghemostelium lacteum]|eukprot:KYR00422.1 hypothetical protein DLAC_03177 [Tieghemostelium lacteum]
MDDIGFRYNMLNFFLEEKEKERIEEEKKVEEEAKQKEIDEREKKIRENKEKQAEIKLKKQQEREEESKTFPKVIRLFIGNLNPQVNTEDMKQLFSVLKDTDVQSLEKIYDATTSEYKGFGYCNVHFGTIDAFEQCTKSLDKAKWKGRVISIQKSKPSYLVKWNQVQEAERLQLEKEQQEREQKEKEEKEKYEKWKSDEIEKWKKRWRLERKKMYALYDQYLEYIKQNPHLRNTIKDQNSKSNNSDSTNSNNNRLPRLGREYSFLNNLLDNEENNNNGKESTVDFGDDNDEYEDEDEYNIQKPTSYENDYSKSAKANITNNWNTQNYEDTYTKGNNNNKKSQQYEQSYEDQYSNYNDQYDNQYEGYGDENNYNNDGDGEEGKQITYDIKKQSKEEGERKRLEAFKKRNMERDRMAASVRSTLSSMSNEVVTFDSDDDTPTVKVSNNNTTQQQQQQETHQPNTYTNSWNNQNYEDTYAKGYNNNNRNNNNSWNNNNQNYEDTTYAKGNNRNTWNNNNQNYEDQYSNNTNNSRYNNNNNSWNNESYEDSYSKGYNNKFNKHDDNNQEKALTTPEESERKRLDAFKKRSMEKERLAAAVRNSTKVDDVITFDSDDDSKPKSKVSLANNTMTEITPLPVVKRKAIPWKKVPRYDPNLMNADDLEISVEQQTQTSKPKESKSKLKEKSEEMKVPEHKHDEPTTTTKTETEITQPTTTKKTKKVEVNTSWRSLFSKNHQIQKKEETSQQSEFNIFSIIKSTVDNSSSKDNQKNNNSSNVLPKFSIDSNQEDTLIINHSNTNNGDKKQSNTSQPSKVSTGTSFFKLDKKEKVKEGDNEDDDDFWGNSNISNKRKLQMKKEQEKQQDFKKFKSK